MSGIKKAIRIPMDAIQIGKAFYNLRDLQDISSAEVGRRLHMNRSSITNREKNGMHWIDNLLPYFDAIGYKVEVLISPK